MLLETVTPPGLEHDAPAAQAGGSEPPERLSTSTAAASLRTRNERPCLSYGGSGNTRQRRCLSHGGSGNTRQRRCLSHGSSENRREKALSQPQRQWKHKAKGSVVTRGSARQVGAAAAGVALSLLGLRPPKWHLTLIRLRLLNRPRLQLRLLAARSWPPPPPPGIKHVLSAHLHVDVWSTCG